MIDETPSADMMDGDHSPYDALDALGIRALVVQRDGTITHMSSVWSARSRHSVPAVVGDSLAAIIDAADADRVLATFAASERDATWTDEYRLRNGDGSVRWVLASITPVRGDDPRASWCMTLTDIDEHKRTLDAIRESEALYRALNDALPGITFVAAPTGELQHIFDRWLNTDEAFRNAALGDGWLAAVHPDDLDRVKTAWSHALQTGEQYKIEYRVRVADGTFHWLLVRALPERRVDGSIMRWVGVIIDIEDRHASEEAREMYAALVENSSDFIAILDLAGRIVYVNQAGRELLEIGSLADACAAAWPDYFLTADHAFVRSTLLAAVERDGKWSGDFRFRHFRSGNPVPIGLNVFALENAAGRRLGIATVSRDLRERKRIEEGLRLLSRTGAAMVDSLEYGRTLEKIARAFVDGFAAYCLIDVIAPSGPWERTVRHRDPAFEELLLSVEQPRGNHPIARTIETGISSTTRIDDEWARNLDLVRDRLEPIRKLRVRSIITVPIMTPAGEIAGAITCALDDTNMRENYGPDDLGFVEEVGRRVGSAIANVRIYERERRVALELQSASLPASLPMIDGVRLDAAYEPGSNEANIGGDWYDAFVLADGRLVITVGDVLGHGLQAAVSMTKLRLAMQSAAMIDANPTLMLRVADATLRLSDPNAYATAIAAIYDGVTRTLTFACAGHPGPALRTADGAVEIVSGYGSMLGLRTGDEAQTQTIAIDAGSTLVFYTDGLIEMTRDIDEGYHRLTAALQGDDLLRASRPAHVLVESVLGSDTAHDDIAVLFVRFD